MAHRFWPCLSLGLAGLALNAGIWQYSKNLCKASQATRPFSKVFSAQLGIPNTVPLLAWESQTAPPSPPELDRQRNPNGNRPELKKAAEQLKVLVEQIEGDAAKHRQLSTDQIEDNKKATEDALKALAERMLKIMEDYQRTH